MEKFKILQGSHSQDGTLHGTGDKFESPHKLDKIFPDRFERISKGKAPKADDTPDTPDVDKDADNVEDTAKDRGELANGDFKYDPEDTGLHVFKKKRKYFVYDIDDATEALNEEGLTKAKVLPFINSQCEE